jgi:hypothetical protein
VEISKHEDDKSQLIIYANLPKRNNNECGNNNFRGSKFRGPSKNRKKWQVFKMINKKTVRIGAVNSEIEAA